MQKTKNKCYLPSLAPYDLLGKSKFLRMATRAILMIKPLPKFPASFSTINHLVLNTPETVFTSKLYYFLPACFYIYILAFWLFGKLLFLLQIPPQKSFLIFLLIKILSFLLTYFYNSYILSLLYLSHWYWNLFDYKSVSPLTMGIYMYHVCVLKA